MDQLKMTVSELNSNMKKLLDSRPGLKDIWIQGEISNFKINLPSGHMYLTLKDEKSVLKACMFRGANQNLTFRPEDGMKVLARGRVTVYEPGGTYQLYIEELILDGLGELYAAFNQLKEKLRAEGLFDEELKKPIPEYPKRVGVITSDTGAAVRDIINVIKRRFRYADIILYPSKVQGEGAAENVCRGIEYFNITKSVDVIIAGRGGGSIEDLWAFNEEITARAIFASEIPIISAVGHEIDFTIADFVADLRAPTPSAAAELAVPSSEEIYEKLSVNKERMKNALLQALRQRQDHLTYAKRMLSSERFLDKLNNLMILVDSKNQYMVKIAWNLLKEKEKNLAVNAAKLDSLSPLGVLGRGYGIVTDYKDSVIKSVKDLDKGMKVGIRLSDGSVKARIEEVLSSESEE
ncbi:MAG: exodeoxyribonuclease VII large subunit [Clostridia bacterium]|nr:exodeoxyribonuclease VII large subunit [Clostridia bacterium]